MLCVAEIESNCGVSEPFQLGSEDHIKGVILVLVLSSRSQRKLGLTSRPERRCGCGSILKTRRQTIRKPCRLTDALTNKARADQTNPRSSARCGRVRAGQNQSDHIRTGSERDILKTAPMSALPQKADIAELSPTPVCEQRKRPTISFHRCDSVRSGFAAVRSRVPVGNTPDRAARVISDQQRAILGDCKRGRASPHLCALLTGYPEAGARLSLR